MLFYALKKQALWSFLICFSLLLITSPLASALSEEQKGLYNSYIHYFDAASCSSAGSGVALTGSGNKGKIFNYLVGTMGLKPFQAAGVMGSIQVESGFEPERQQSIFDRKVPAESFPDPAGGSGWGLVQWTPGSKMIDTFSPKSKANNLGAQLYFLSVQLDGKGPLPEKAAGDKLKASTDIVAATQAFELDFERHAGGAQQSRVDNARDILIKYGSESSGGGTEASSDTTACTTSGDSSGEVIGKYSLPVAKKWYTQNKIWFTKPHHDYPAADIPVPTGTKVFAVAKGKVSSLANSGGGGGAGTHVFINDGGVVYGYFHGTPGSVRVKVGDAVEAGQLLMLSDNSGHSEGSHLHFQIEVSGTKRCPQSLLEAIGDGKDPPDINSLPASGCVG